MENGQTFVSDDLSALAPPEVELQNLWRDFRKVVEFIDQNNEWLHPMLEEIDRKLVRTQALVLQHLPLD